MWASSQTQQHYKTTRHLVKSLQEVTEDGRGRSLSLYTVADQAAKYLRGPLCTSLHPFCELSCHRRTHSALRTPIPLEDCQSLFSSRCKEEVALKFMRAWGNEAAIRLTFFATITSGLLSLPTGQLVSEYQGQVTQWLLSHY